LVELHILKYKNSTLDPCVARVGDLVQIVVIDLSTYVFNILKKKTYNFEKGPE